MKKNFSILQKHLHSKTYHQKVLKSSAHSCSETLTKLFNDTLNNSEFPDELKLAEVTATFKKGDPIKSRNYRPLSVLPRCLKD